jgi:hypothetical protein
VSSTDHVEIASVEVKIRESNENIAAAQQIIQKRYHKKRDGMIGDKVQEECIEKERSTQSMSIYVF